MSGGAKRSSLNQTLNEIDSFLDIKIERVSSYILLKKWIS